MCDIYLYITQVVTMLIQINPADELPIYRQIIHQIRDAIAAGELAPGSKLLSHRDLSAQIVVAPLTVKKAYDELEANGLLETRRGKGTFVSKRPPRASAASMRKRVGVAANRLLTEARLAGLDLDEVVDLLKALDESLENREEHK
jgi:GntR family transcriptional regulator